MSISVSQSNPYVQPNIFSSPAYNAPIIDEDPMSLILLQKKLNDQVQITNSQINGSIFEPTGPSYVTPINPADFSNPQVQDPNAPAQTEADSKDDLGVMGGVGRILASPVKFAWEVIKSGGKYIKNVFSGAWRATGGAIGTLLSGHPIDALGEVLGGLWDVVKSPFELLWDVGSDCVNFVGDILGGVGNIIGGIGDGISSFFKGIFS